MTESRTDNPERIRIHAIVPAAGLSRRMGRSKQTLPYGDSTITGRVVRALVSAGVDTIIVVTRTELADALDLPEVAGARIVINDDPATEMIDSIRLGLAAIADDNPRDTDGVLIVPGDMPDISPRACRSCMATFREDSTRIVIAVHQGRRGHPIIFPISLRPDVDRLSEGLRQLPQQHPDRVVTVPTKDAGILHDVDTPEQYRRERLAREQRDQELREQGQRQRKHRGDQIADRREHDVD